MLDKPDMINPTVLQFASARRLSASEGAGLSARRPLPALIGPLQITRGIKGRLESQTVWSLHGMDVPSVSH